MMALGLSMTTAVANPIGGLTDEALTDTSKVVDLDEVVVVAQPKEQVRLRLQPVSSSVFGSEQLQQLNVRDLSQLSQYVPSFVMPSYGSRLTSSMYVRGIGSRINNPAVGVYYDNIPLMSKAAFNNHFYMLDRVDILRGPQGSLYGQNTEGGLVRVYSKDPTKYQGTDIRLGIGNGLWRNVEVAHHHRPSESLAFTVAGFYSGLKGFINNQNFEDKNDKSLEAGGKARLIWLPSAKLKLDWTADYQWTNQNGFGYGEMGTSMVDITDPATTVMNGYRRNMFTTGLSLSADMGSLLFTSTTSYQFLQDRMLMDQDYMTPDYLQLEQRQKMNAFTQEFVVRSHDTHRWQHTSGLFASYQWLRTDAPVTFGPDMRAMLAKTILGYMPERVQSMFTTWEIPTLDVTEQFHTPQLNLALFHESNILTPTACSRPSRRATTRASPSSCRRSDSPTPSASSSATSTPSSRKAIVPEAITSRCSATSSRPTSWPTARTSARCRTRQRRSSTPPRTTTPSPRPSPTSPRSLGTSSSAPT